MPSLSAVRVARVAASVLFVALFPPGVARAAPQVWVLNSADRAFSTTTRPANALSSISLHAARDESEAAQILVRSTTALSGVSVTLGALTGPNGAILAAANVRVDRQYLHPNILKIQGGQEPPGGGTAYYDALVGNAPVSVPASVTQPYLYRVYVPASQPPGVYTGSAIVRSGDGDVTVPVSLKVYDVTLPPADRATLKVNNWFTSAGWDYAGTVASIPLQYGVSQFDANWWRVIGNIATNHRRHRNNVIFADFQGLLIPHTTVDASGRYTFDWSSFDRFIELFRAAGTLQFIYTPHLLERTSAGVRMDMIKLVGGVPQRVLGVPNTPETNAYLDQLFPALKAHLDAKGWTDLFYMSALDEPHSTDEFVSARWLYAKYRQYFPRPRLNEAHLFVTPEMENELTAITPEIDVYAKDDGVAYYQRQRLAGKELWLYNCIGPQGPYMNRFISFHLARTRLTPWLVWQVGGSGYLHWGWNYWVRASNGTWVGEDTFNGSQTGDNWLVYPNRAAYDVYDSLRSEAQLDGVEDFELLNLLAARKPLTARAIADTLVTDPVTYTTSGVEVEARHRQLLEELASLLPDGQFAFSDDFSTGEHHWRHSRGTWSVTTSGEYSQTDSSRWDFTAALEGRAYTDVAASVDVRIAATNPVGGDTNWAGLVLRGLNGTDVGSGYLVALRNTGEVFVNRSGTTLGAATVPGYVPFAYHRLRVTAVGGTLRVWVGNNTAPVLTVNDSAFTSGAVALATGGVSASFDNVRLNPSINAAEGTAVSASSSYSADGWSTGALVDGQRTSVPGALGWSSSSNMTINHTESVTVDLGRVRPASRVDLYPRSDSGSLGAGFPIDFTVAVSANGTTWTTVASRTGYPRPGAGAQSFPFVTTDVRYVRVTGTRLGQDGFGNYHMQLAELEVLGGSLAAGRPVTASSSVQLPAEGWRPLSVTDGVRLSSLWHSMGWSSSGQTTNPTEWLTVDLGGPSRISRVDLFPRSDGENTGLGFPIDYTVAVSADNVTWTTVASVTGAPRPGAGAQSVAFTPVQARYVRVQGTRLRTDPTVSNMMQLAELEVW